MVQLCFLVKAIYPQPLQFHLNSVQPQTIRKNMTSLGAFMEKKMEMKSFTISKPENQLIQQFHVSSSIKIPFHSENCNKFESIACLG